ncbi:MAG TPA: hypothetical protein VG929_09270 [Actinomycetota bacterium]|nr:hypothetical protein [Actinomycetota bacterium]
MRRSFVGIPSLFVIAGLLCVAAGPAARAQTSSACFDASEETPERYGPTDISAVSGNGGLSVALNPAGTVTVLKWPSPSFYDHVKYRTTDRAEPRYGALVNEGAFVGIATRASRGTWKFTWLRDWPQRQRFSDDDTDEVVTIYAKRRLGVRVKQRDLVAHEEDVLYRQLVVTRSKRSRVRKVRIISFANFNPVVSKTPQSPTNDWCEENDEDDGARYRRQLDAIVQERSGTDASTGNASGVAIAMGFRARSQAHQIGTDTYAGEIEGRSAYDDASDGKLSGRNAAPGPVDAAIADQLALKRSRRAATTIVIATAFSRSETATVLRNARSTAYGKVRRAKNAWWRKWLRRAQLPRNAPNAVTDLAKRSLITLRQATDDARAMTVKSISTQPPYGVDSIREGASVNAALHRAGHPDMVAAHNVRYADLQASAGDPPQGGPVIPPGNWADSYYADGVDGGPLPYEIDDTGYGMWTLWDHYARTGDRAYLFERGSTRIYEAIQRSAHYLSESPPFGCTDPTTGLHCPANEDGNPTATQTLVGAQAVWLGLGAAVLAADVRGTEVSAQNGAKWSTRREELGAAIDRYFFDEECNCYTRDHKTGGAFLWPVGYVPYGSGRAEAQAAVNYEHMDRIFSGETTSGSYESTMLLGNAYAWAGTSNLRKVRRGLWWVASVATTDGTRLLGEAWMRYPEGGPVTTMVAQPHAPSHALFYLAALKAYGAKPYSFD